MSIEGDKWIKVRADFPILDQRVNNRPLVYLDNAATTQMPTCVLDAIANHYRTANANVYRASHTLSARSTSSLEMARKRVAQFLGAETHNEIIFTRGTTDSINLVASSLGQKWGSDFSALATAMEHHSNFVPWQQAALRTGGMFDIVPLDGRGDLDFAILEEKLASQRPGIFAVAHVSNVLGTVNPLSRIIEAAHAKGWLVLVDSAQGVRHEELDVQDLGCDFLCFSGHKIMGPTGIGVLYGREDLLNDMPPVAFGGEMVDRVRMAETTFETAPLRFESGTPNYVGALGLATALDYLDELGWTDIRRREHELLAQLERGVRNLASVQVLGSPRERAGVLSFTVEGAHPFDIATLLDKMGIAVRSGNQCAQPLLCETYTCEKVVRFSPAFYNTEAEIDAAIEGLRCSIDLCIM